jgi:hypothetical protein
VVVPHRRTTHRLHASTPLASFAGAVGLRERVRQNHRAIRIRH